MCDRYKTNRWAVTINPRSEMKNKGERGRKVFFAARHASVFSWQVARSERRPHMMDSISWSSGKQYADSDTKVLESQGWRVREMCVRAVVEKQR